MQKKSLIKYKIILSYDGTNYRGWQIQPNARTIQEILENSFSTILKEKIKLLASGRTDAGVHAKEQVCHFEVEKEVDTDKLLFILNCMLDKDIRIKTLQKVEHSFHARFSAKSKIYHYHICLKEVQDPFSRYFAYKPFYKIDIDLLKQASKKFLGKKDFTSFANKPNEGSAKNNPIKNLKRLDVIKTKTGIRLEFEANGFLYKMVRNITGTLLDIASNQMSIDSLDKIFNAKDRTKVGKPAPAKALFLEKVIY